MSVLDLELYLEAVCPSPREFADCIPLAQSYICGNDHITSSSVRCPCGSTNLASLARILDRRPAQ